ncbi:AAA family ATPase [Endobacterium cereale]|jgi:thymidylate kinase|uniref:AAA family ATPase n=1 Tax=Endobacterium cereale TaxID=2663029 RepID=UPI001AD95036|nr:nucleoside kinase [Endobacterium cereale]MEB2846858.1 nucleoside kinase [Endobacterium cereale]
MAIRNYLIEGISGAGKTSVATELERRGYHVIHGDRTLAYSGDPRTGEPLENTAWHTNSHDPGFVHAHHVWDINKVRTLLVDQNHPVSFFCGGSRNFHQFIGLFDGVFVLDIDVETLKSRLAERPDGEFGSNPGEQALILRLHATKEDIPASAVAINATRPLASVVDDLLAKCITGS